MISKSSSFLLLVWNRTNIPGTPGSLIHNLVTHGFTNTVLKRIMFNCVQSVKNVNLRSIMNKLITWRALLLETDLNRIRHVTPSRTCYLVKRLLQHNISDIILCDRNDLVTITLVLVSIIMYAMLNCARYKSRPCIEHFHKRQMPHLYQ